ncbi:hypothetical protein BDZ97DRAFT_850476 [Flammula alnicola]|nr:hypothetical protein BDZ97DRAFT_850476 [Flammula alnicola]
MADGRPRRDELKETASSTRRRSGSEIIRKRVAHLLQSSSIPVSLDESPVTSIRDGTDRRSSPLPQSNLNSSVDRYHKPDAKDTPMTLSSNPPRSLKRKKSLTSASQPNHFDKPENRIVHATRTPLASSPHVYSPFVSTPMSRPPPLHSELPPISSVKNGKTVTAKHSSHQPHDSHIGRAYNEANKNDAIRRDVSQEPVFTGPLQ